MATIKSFTDLSQSKKLAEILPLESADMYYREWKRDTKDIRIAHVGTAGKEDLQCWSLAALLGVLPNGIIMHKDGQNGKYHCCSTYARTYIKADNPVDACVAMIKKLHELKVL